MSLYIYTSPSFHSPLWSVKLIHVVCLRVPLSSCVLLAFVNGRHQPKIRRQDKSKVWVCILLELFLRSHQELAAASGWLL